MTPMGARPPHPRAAKGRPYEGHRSTGGSGTRPYGRAGNGGPAGTLALTEGAGGIVVPHGLDARADDIRPCTKIANLGKGKHLAVIMRGQEINEGVPELPILKALLRNPGGA